MAAHVHSRIVQYGTIPGGRSLVPPHLVGKVEGLGNGEDGSLGLSRELTKMKETGKEFVSGQKLASGKNVCEVKISPSSSCV